MTNTCAGGVDTMFVVQFCEEPWGRVGLEGHGVFALFAITIRAIQVNLHLRSYGVGIE